MNEAIQNDVLRRGITRLCHFTPSRSLAHILATGAGVLPTRLLKEEERLLFNPTDLQRLDGHVDHICCSIEYPNAWYLDRARATETLFRDWVILFVGGLYTLQTTLIPGSRMKAQPCFRIRVGWAAWHRSMSTLALCGRTGRGS